MSDAIGAVGARVTFEATVEAVISFGINRYGWNEVETFLVKMRTPAGKIVVWKTGSPGDLERGDKITAVATIKEIGEYRGEEQTKVLRLKTTRRTTAAGAVAA